MNETAAAWIRNTVLTFYANPARPKAIRAARAGGPCICARAWLCCACRNGHHTPCVSTETGQEQGLYGPGLTWPPRAAVRLADRVCHTRCACPRCTTAGPEPLGQLDLFGAAL